MADSDQAQLPPAALRQANFEQSVAYSLHLWPALTLSVQNNWGGPDSADKRDWFAGAVVDLFPEFTDNGSNSSDPSFKNGNSSSSSKSKVSEEPDQEYLETFLLQVMVDEFEVNVDDDSGVEAAEQIMRARAQCAEGQFDEYNTLRERFANRKGKKVDALFKKIEDANQDTDWETDDSGDDDGDDDDDDEAGGDAQMRDAPPPREKAPPEVDEDGFTKVTRKR